MSSLKTEAPQRTALYSVHERLGARFFDFAGWEMPIEYSGILDEHRAVREAAGLFDVSHMGIIRVAGPQAEELVQRAVTNDVSALPPGRALYSPVCRPDGGTLDDVIIYRMTPSRFLLVVNASNRRKDFNWFGRMSDGFPETRVDLVSGRAILALQGPRAEDVLEAASGASLGGLPFFSVIEGFQVVGVPCIVARAGYTGEDGFEIICEDRAVIKLWETILNAGRTFGIAPCGLGARDTLRLEAALPLYGHELSEEINPYEAGLGRFVKLEKGDFIGREALQAVKERGGPDRVRVGLMAEGRVIPRQGYEVFLGDDGVGVVTSGGFSPFLNKGIALALVSRSVSSLGQRLNLNVRGRAVECEVVKLPFYRSPHKGA